MGINIQIHDNKDDSKKAALLGSSIIHFFKPQIKSKIKITPLKWLPSGTSEYYLGGQEKKERNKQTMYRYHWSYGSN